MGSKRPHEPWLYFKLWLVQTCPVVFELWTETCGNWTKPTVFVRFYALRRFLLSKNEFLLMPSTCRSMWIPSTSARVDVSRPIWHHLVNGILPAMILDTKRIPKINRLKQPWYLRFKFSDWSFIKKKQVLCSIMYIYSV